METKSEDKPVRVAVILGSVRPHNYTRMAARLVVDELEKDPKVTVEVVDPAVLDLPFPGMPPTEGTRTLQRAVNEATGVVLATPEYHGSFSSVMKLVIENLGFPSALAGKPVALLGVAAGAIGAIKSLEHLRGVVSHVGAIALPTPVSVANVQRVFDKEGHCLEPAVERLVRAVAGTLLAYVERNICPRITLERILREGPAALPPDVVTV
jgi:chromate reductase, NAD(P)H dehydrogenase (quinone)